MSREENQYAPSVKSRCKMKCESSEKTANWDKTKSDFLYKTRFSIVTCGSPENDSFFKSTPAGSLEFSSIGGEYFTPGKTYYVDISEA